MTQHLDRPVTPMIDTAVAPAATTPVEGTPQVQNPGWPPPGPAGYGTPTGYGAPTGYGTPAGTVAPGAVAAEPPLNTLSWLSVVAAFVVSPVAIVLGAISRRQIARTGERGRGLATTGIALGIVFTLMGILSTILVLSMVTTVTYTPAPAPVPAAAPSPAAAAPAATDAGATGSSAGSSAGSSTGSATGQADLLTAYLDLIGANQTFDTNWQAHDTAAELRADISEYRNAVSTFRDAVAAADVPAEQRARLDSQLLPAIDKVLADCDGMLNAQTDAKVKAAAKAFDADNPAMVQTAADAISS